MWLAFTKSVGGRIAATEFMNEPTYAAMGGAPKGYNAADYGRDIAVFGPWLKQNSPGHSLPGPWVRWRRAVRNRNGRNAA